MSMVLDFLRTYHAKYPTNLFTQKKQVITIKEKSQLLNCKREIVLNENTHLFLNTNNTISYKVQLLVDTKKEVSNRTAKLQRL